MLYLVGICSRLDFLFDLSLILSVHIWLIMFLGLCTCVMQSFAVTGAANTILAIAIVTPTGTDSSGSTTNNKPLIVGLVVGLGGGLMLIAAGAVYTVFYIRRKRAKGKVWDSFTKQQIQPNLFEIVSSPDSPPPRRQWPGMPTDEETAEGSASQKGISMYPPVVPATSPTVSPTSPTVSPRNGPTGGGSTSGGGAAERSAESFASAHAAHAAHIAHAAHAHPPVAKTGAECNFHWPHKA